MKKMATARTMNDYEKHWHDLNVSLNEIENRDGDLRTVFTALQAHQLETGFIRDDLEAVERFEFCHPKIHERCLRIQFNPSRATRSQGAGILSPPPRVSEHHDGCFLCPANIRWQQQGRQFGYELDINGQSFIAWMNPFPLMPGHIVLASKSHLGQEWSLHPSGTLDPQQIVADLIELVARAPGYAGFYNGVDAGASIPEHLHYQLFKSPADKRRFPLEIVARAARNARPGQPGWRLDKYPVESMHWYGEPQDIIEQSSRWIGQWVAHQQRLPDLTANILAISEEQSAKVALFFVPRDRRKSRASGLSGQVGGLEVLGELVYSTPEEQHKLASGELNYFSLEQVLAEVRTSLNMP